MSNVCTQANMIYTYVNLYVVSVTPGNTSVMDSRGQV